MPVSGFVLTGSGGGNVNAQWTQESELYEVIALYSELDPETPLETSDGTISVGPSEWATGTAGVPGRTYWAILTATDFAPARTPDYVWPA
jgi:hypothetical protein